MEKPKLRYINAYVDRHGKARYYFRRKGTQIALPGAPGSRIFMRAYEQALGGSKVVRSRPAELYTWRRLIDEFYKSKDFASIKKVTQGTYKGELERFAKSFGDLDVRDMDYAAVDKLMAAMKNTPAAANNRLKRMRQCFVLAIRLKWIKADPSVGITPYKTGTVHTWTEEEVAQFEAHWPIGTFERTAFALHVYTGQRRGDVNAMTWPEGGKLLVTTYFDEDGNELASEQDDDVITLSQEKTGTRVDIPVHPLLAEALAAWPKKHDRILYGTQGKPVGKERMGEMMGDAIKDAGLPTRCRMHGLRKVAAKRLADAGCTAHEIMAITGHKSIQEVQRYAEQANRKRLAKSADRKLRAIK